eukprot:1251539-Prymnesium_polylepis.1
MANPERVRGCVTKGPRTHRQCVAVGMRGMANPERVREGRWPKEGWRALGGGRALPTRAVWVARPSPAGGVGGVASAYGRCGEHGGPRVGGRKVMSDGPSRAAPASSQAGPCASPCAP